MILMEVILVVHLQIYFYKYIESFMEKWKLHLFLEFMDLKFKEKKDQSISKKSKVINLVQIKNKYRIMMMSLSKIWTKKIIL